MSAASISSQASANRTSRKPIATMNGSRSAARIGGSTALSTAIAAAPANAAPVVSSPKPGSTHAATVSEAAAHEPAHENAQRPQAQVVGLPVRRLAV